MIIIIIIIIMSSSSSSSTSSSSSSSMSVWLTILQYGVCSAPLISSSSISWRGDSIDDIITMVSER